MNDPMRPLTEFGTPTRYTPLDEVDVLDSYDSVPLLTILKDPDSGEFWMELWVDISDDRTTNRYLHTKLSEERINEYLSGKVSLRDLFIKTEECMLVENDPKAEGEPGAAWCHAVCLTLPTSQVPESYFSREDSFISRPIVLTKVSECQA
jgi:hypothetical protein